MQRFLDLLISINCSTCFRRFLRPSSGEQNCIYSVRYCQTNTTACCYRGWDVTKFHLIHDSSRQQYWFDNTWLCMYSFVLLMLGGETDGTPWSSISSTIVADSSIGLTIPDAVCTVLCSWWWAEEPPETCRAIYRNKQTEKTLHLVGCILKRIKITLKWRCSFYDCCQHRFSSASQRTSAATEGFVSTQHVKVFSEVNWTPRLRKCSRRR